MDRIRGLEPVLESCAGKSVLDVGCSVGLVSFEFARHGATSIRGFELHRPSLKFAEQLLSYLPVESRFQQFDLARGVAHLKKQIEAEQPADFDIVLFLGMYQHLVLQMDRAELSKLLCYLAQLCRECLVVRLPEKHQGDVKQDLSSASLRLTRTVPGAQGSGSVLEFQRI